jgi:hypothetical protein
MTTETNERRVPRHDDSAEPVDWLTIRVPIAASYGNPEQFRDDAERILLLFIALKAAGARRHEVERRMRGYEPRDAFDQAA